MSSLEYLDFELRIGPRRDDGSHAVTATSDIGLVEGIARFDQEQLDNLRVELAALAAGRMRRVSPAFRRAQEFGDILFRSLPVEVRGHYARLRERAREQERGVRLKLDMRDPRLALMPWEFLRDDQDFLVRSTSTPLVRWPTHDVSLSSLSDPELRVLVVIANPTDARVPGVGEEKRRLRQALTDKPRVRVDFLDDKAERVTLASVQRELRRSQSEGRRYHVLHFIGHGLFEREGDGEGYLLFEDDDGHSLRASDAQVKWVIGDHPLRLVVLNACEGAQIDETDALAGVAASLVQAGIPAVVAMQFEISGDAAASFAGEFYQAILDGYPVDAAVAEGRKAILRDLGEGSIEWGTPVLFTRYVDGQLLEVIREDVPSPPAVEAPAPPKTEPSTTKPPPRIRTEVRVAIIGMVGVIGAALIGILPNLLRPNNPTVVPATAVSPSPVFSEEAPLPASDPKTLDQMMIRVPVAERFIMGDSGEKHPVPVDAFDIDRYEVTNLQYQRFISDTGHPPPPLWQGRNFPDGQAGRPVVDVSWHDARAYCEWVGKRLPTEAEWELAARGTDQRPYPWGQDWDARKANTLESNYGRPVNVGSYSPAGDSPYGVADMAGNVFEWVSSMYQSYPYRSDDGREDLSDNHSDRVVRGGSWQLDKELARTTFRLQTEPETTKSDIGFRCVRSAISP